MRSETTDPSGDGVLALVDTKVLARVLIVLAKLLDHVTADVGEVLLDLLCNTERILWWDSGLVAVTKELLHEGRDVAPGNGDVANGRSDNVTLSL